MSVFLMFGGWLLIFCAPSAVVVWLTRSKHRALDGRVGDAVERLTRAAPAQRRLVAGQRFLVGRAGTQSSFTINTEVGTSCGIHLFTGRPADRCDHCGMSRHRALDGRVASAGVRVSS